MAITTSTTPEVKPERLKELLKKLVDIYSPSGKEEEILQFTEDYLKETGLNVKKQPVDENRYNIVVLPPKTDEVDLCFVGHLDTVTAHDLDDFGFYEEEDKACGLGSSDMKAGCAAMIEAFNALAERRGRFPSVGLALVVGEEEESDGAKTLVREYRFPWAVVAEPTNMLPCLGHFGYLEVLLRTRGKKAHSSMPELGQNAIENMLKLLLRVTEYATSVSSGLVYNIRQLSGFPGGFVVPDTCEAWLDLHLPPDSRMDVLKAELEELVESASREITSLDAYIRFENTQSGYRISQERPLVRKLREVCKNMKMSWETQDFRSHSDGNVLWGAGVDPIILGPGRLETAHTPEESVNFSQVVQAAQLYLSFALAI
ncbi:MAG: M20/M25/M40 family metallo-hydrolase [Dehalococcoidia bacterium]|nr:M20/M25/M40 family metallo-hydrolase [Dehalococcoidia bacterium]MDD5493292.1 M20/M25/M40 family metallo-hydrolase [Dehalococcoidia bacterium]